MLFHEVVRVDEKLESSNAIFLENRWEIDFLYFHFLIMFKDIETTCDCCDKETKEQKFSYHIILQIGDI